MEMRIRQARRIASVLSVADLIGCFWPVGIETARRNLDARYEYACRRRAKLGFDQSVYNDWYQEHYLLSPKDRHAIGKETRRWSRLPKIEVILLDPFNCSPQDRMRTLDSLDSQLYKGFTVKHFRSSEPRGMNVSLTSLSRSPGWKIVIPVGALLSEYTIYLFARAILANPNACMVYTDSDHYGLDGNRVLPQFRPDWSPELIRSANFIGLMLCWRQQGELHGPVFKSFSDNVHYLALASSHGKTAREIIHLPAIAFSVPEGWSNSELCRGNPATVVASFFKKFDIPASVSALGDDRFEIFYSLPSVPPLVSIVIPTRDRVDLLRPCVESIFSKTLYTNYELIIVDNSSSDPAALEYLSGLELHSRISVIRYEDEFNYSAINNFAVEFARGDVICLLNNDTEVITPDWLEKMLGILLQPNVGAVGAKLLFPDNTVQHAGDAVGPGGCADHYFSGLGAEEGGYCGRALLAQDLSAVTGACLLTLKRVYLELGGLDEGNLPVAFNDVDYCLRLLESGRRVVWTPHAKLYHHESVSRGVAVSEMQVLRARGEVMYMKKRWAKRLVNDPFYNPNLNYGRPDFALSPYPRILKPWKYRDVFPTSRRRSTEDTFFSD